jgi:hypothetical protein
VNQAYPEGLPYTSVPPTLLLRIPKLPEEVAYRIVGCKRSYKTTLAVTSGRSATFIILSGLEPLLIKYGVNAVFSGHEHVYERIQPQQGIYYFTEGVSGQLRYGNLRKSGITGKGFDTDRTFMLVEIAGEEMYVFSDDLTHGRNSGLRSDPAPGAVRC